jgi:hypothetical protein
MDELMDMMVDDASASQISDKIKDLLYAKSAERVDEFRPHAATSLFGNDESEVNGVEDNVSDEEEVVAAADDEI